MASFLEVPYKNLPRKFSSDLSIPTSVSPTAEHTNRILTGSLPTSPKQIAELKVSTADGNHSIIPLNQSSDTTSDSLLESTLENINIDLVVGKEVFSLWITSPNLQLQLKDSHKPVRLAQQWKSLLLLYSDLTVEEIGSEIPRISMRRSAFLTLKREKRIVNSDLILTHLFYEARDNFLNSRWIYPLRDSSETLKLGAYLLLTEEGEFKESTHTAEWLLTRFRICHFLPVRLSGGKGPFYVPTQSKKVSLSKQLIHSVQTQCTKGHSINTLRKLFLQSCQNLPYYGSVFFRAQVERPSNMFSRLAFGARDRQILVALNSEALHILDYESCDVMFTLYHQHFSWLYQPPSRSGEDEFCSIWIEFSSVMEDSTSVAKQLQIFSKQAPLMDSLIQSHVSHLEQQEFAPSPKTSGSEPITALRVDQLSQTPHTGEKHFSLYSFSLDGEKIPSSRVKRGLTSFKKNISKP